MSGGHVHSIGGLLATIVYCTGLLTLKLCCHQQSSARGDCITFLLFADYRYPCFKGEYSYSSLRVPLPSDWFIVSLATEASSCKGPVHSR